ncbi:hypothetical protein HND97_11435 [Vibrio cholerae]|nr:hypothetical protein HND97_11435 [Vibrio cholerae]
MKVHFKRARAGRSFKGESLSVSNDSIRYGLGVAIYQDRLYGDIYGHRGWLPGYTSGLRYYKDFGVSIVLQINTDEIDLSNGDDVLTRLESMLADFAFNKVNVDQ